MLKFKGVLILITICLSVFCSACNSGEADSPSSQSLQQSSNVQSSTYQQISQDEAYDIMKSESNYIILDTRSAEEFEEGHIVGAVNLDYEEVNEKAEGMLPDKSQLILVYCRSGRRSKIAAQSLADLGYTNVKEFGGIIDWPYEVEK